MDLLTNLTKDGCLGSIVYHIDTIVHVNGRYYYNQPIYSLEYLNLDQHHFMASGSDVKKNLRIYKYTPLREPFCAELYNPTYYDFPMYGSAYPKTLGFVNVEEPMTHTEHRDLENPIKIKCYYDMKTSYKEE